MTEDFHHHPRLYGVRVSYIAGDKTHMTRSLELAHTNLIKQHHREGFLWISRRIDTATRYVDPPFSRDDTVWEERTYAYRISRLEKLLAPAIRKARFPISMAMVRLSFSGTLYDASEKGTPGARPLLLWALRTRRNPNFLTDQELSKHLGTHVYAHINHNNTKP